MIEIIDEQHLLNEEEYGWIRTACKAAFAEEEGTGDLSVRIDTPDSIRELNREFRAIDRVTDVLTFPAWEGEVYASADGYLGDIMICYDRAKEQAEEYGHSLQRELAFLAIHGMLHLFGYDHMNEAEETVMRDKQTKILEGMGLKR